MKLYTRLYESLLEYSGGCGYTVAMLALGLGLSLNLLSVMNLLWTLRVLHHPYGTAGSLRPEHYVFALLYGGFIANTILARIKYTADRRDLDMMSELPAPAMESPEAPSAPAPGPAYVLGSAALFAVTLTLGVLTHR
jgi:hypothetical protein